VTGLSPDGTRAGLDIRDQESDIWICNLARETLMRLTFGPALGLPHTPHIGKKRKNNEKTRPHGEARVTADERKGNRP
jgi:hypothetical protein